MLTGGRWSGSTRSEDASEDGVPDRNDHLCLWLFLFSAGAGHLWWIMAQLGTRYHSLGCTYLPERYNLCSFTTRGSMAFICLKMTVHWYYKITMLISFTNRQDVILTRPAFVSNSNCPCCVSPLIELLQSFR